MKKILLSMFLLIIPFSSMLVKADYSANPNAMMIYGFGIETCGQYVEAYKNGAWQPYINWLQGYATGLAYYNRRYRMLGDDSEGDIASFSLWLNNYCNAHPLDHVLNASNALLKALDPGFNPGKSLSMQKSTHSR